MHPFLTAKERQKPLRYFEQLAFIEDQWTEIYSSVKSPSLFISFDYIRLWYEKFALPHELRIFPIVDGTTLIGFMPLVLRTTGFLRTLSSLTNCHCSHPAALVADGFEKQFVGKLIDRIVADANEWDVLRMNVGYSFHKDTRLYEIAFKDYALHIKKEPAYSIWLPQSYDEYFKKDLSVNTRRIRQRFKNKLRKRASSFGISHFSGEEALAKWPAFLSIEDSGWKGENGTSLKKHPDNYRSYFNCLIRMLSKKSQLHMYFLNIDGQPVSGVFSYTDQEILHVAKTGYKEEFSAFSPSSVLFLFIIEDAINNFPGITRVNLFPGDYGFKHRYINEESFYAEIVMHNKSIRSRGAHLYSKVKTKVNTIIKREKKLVSQLEPR